MTLISTPGARDANSYPSLQDTITYFLKNRIHSEAWDNLDCDRRERAFKWATKLLDERMDYNGWPTNPTVQALFFPQEGQYDKMGNYISSSVVPPEMKYATMELALLLAKSDFLFTQSGLTNVKIGTFSANFSSISNSCLPFSVTQIIAHLGTAKDGNMVKVVRT